MINCLKVLAIVIPIILLVVGIIAKIIDWYDARKLRRLGEERARRRVLFPEEYRLPDADLRYWVDPISNQRYRIDPFTGWLTAWEDDETTCRDHIKIKPRNLPKWM